MHWLLFIHKIIFSSTCIEPQVLIFRRIQLYTCSIWYCHSLWEFLVTCRYTAWVRTDWRGKVVGGILLKMSTWGSKHVEENSILWINNNQCIKVGNYYIVRKDEFGWAFRINERDRVIRTKFWPENVKVKALLDDFICRKKNKVKIHIQDRLKSKVTNTEAEILILTSTLTWHI